MVNISPMYLNSTHYSKIYFKIYLFSNLILNTMTHIGLATEATRHTFNTVTPLVFYIFISEYLCGSFFFIIEQSGMYFVTLEALFQVAFFTPMCLYFTREENLSYSMSSMKLCELTYSITTLFKQFLLTNIFPVPNSSI